MTLSETRKYRKFTARQKLELVLASLRREKTIAELCREHAISETLLRRWRDQVLEAGGEREPAAAVSSTGSGSGRHRLRGVDAAGPGLRRVRLDEQPRVLVDLPQHLLPGAEVRRPPEESRVPIGADGQIGDRNAGVEVRESAHRGE